MSILSFVEMIYWLGKFGLACVKKLIDSKGEKNHKEVDDIEGETVEIEKPDED